MRFGLYTIVVLVCLNNNAFAANLPFINPAKTRVSIAPGKQYFGEITVENPSDEVKSMRVSLEDWYYTPGGDGTKQFVLADTLTRSCSGWIKFSPAEFLLPPFGKQRISYSINVPANASGGYYSAMFFETMMGKMGGEQQNTSAGINLVVQIASLFYVEVEGTLKKTTLIDNLIVERERTNDNLLHIQLNFKNTGNVDITAGGVFNFIDNAGMVYARGEFAKVYTFPGDKGKLLATWKEPIPQGKYDLVLTLDLGKAQEELGLGRGPVYTKEVEIEVGPRDEILRVGELR